MGEEEGRIGIYKVSQVPRFYYLTKLPHKVLTRSICYSKYPREAYKNSGIEEETSVPHLRICLGSYSLTVGVRARYRF